MRFTVAGVFHLYFGDASRHPIVSNYIRSLPDLPQKIVLQSVPQARLRRLLKMIQELLRIRRQRDWVLQCHDVVSGVIGSMLWKGRIIYDSHEIYSSFADRKSVAKMIDWLERFTISRARIVVFPSVYRSEFYHLERSEVRIIENLYYPYDTEEQQESCDVAVPGDEDSRVARMRFVYTGLFTPVRATDEILAAFKHPLLRKSDLILAGKFNSYLESVLAGAPDNVEYLGELSHAAVSNLLKSADAGFALYRPVNENNRRCAPTKIFEFLYFGLQVIASQSPYIMDIKNRYAGDQITALDEITAESILNACLAVDRRGKSIDHEMREAVCWTSQMSTLKSLYD